jgi:hypothetical protein
MDPLTTLYERLRDAAENRVHVTDEHLEDWLRYWNDEDTDLGNLRNFEHWLSRSEAALTRTSPT